MTVLLLMGFLATILLRVLKADFVKFSRGDGEGGSLCCIGVWVHASGHAAPQSLLGPPACLQPQRQHLCLGSTPVYAHCALQSYRSTGSHLDCPSSVAAAAPIEEDESGWKYVHGDVFRFPPLKSLFCAFVGTGTQVRSRAAACWAPGATHALPQQSVWNGL